MVGALRVDDPEARYAAVRLCSDLPLRNPDFVREDGAWILRLPGVRLARLEYQLELVDRDGSSCVVCDPGNPERAPGAFGQKSVATAEDYRPPAWLESRSVEGARQSLGVRILGQEVTIDVWSPTEGSLPMLVVHDGPEYDELASLTRYAGAMIETERLAPFRVALLPPGERDEWYSASAHYSRALCRRVLPLLRRELAVASAPVGMGASLGGLAMLHAQRVAPGSFDALFTQSASFFVPRFDRHEADFPRYARVVRFVRRVIRSGPHPDPVPAGMTCGSEEENIHNNRLMASALATQGYEVELCEVADLHNYTGWRDAFDPHLTVLLERAWREPSRRSASGAG